MHPNPIFRRPGVERNLIFARNRAFGLLSVNGQDGPVLAHVPFRLDADGTSADLHLVRSNPILQALDQPQAAVIVISGPDSYISPDWYEVTDQVPTSNYVAVHLRGHLGKLPQEEMRDMLDRQSAHFEDQLAPKRPWTTHKMTPEVLDRMMRQIVPCRLTVTGIDGTWKLNQNKPDEVRMRAADKVGEDGMGSERATLAILMRTPPQD